MAKDRNQSEETAARRVYRASDVHKRSAKGKPRPAPAEQALDAAVTQALDRPVEPDQPDQSAESEQRANADPKKRRFSLRKRSNANASASPSARKRADGRTRENGDENASVAFDNVSPEEPANQEPAVTRAPGEEEAKSPAAESAEAAAGETGPVDGAPGDQAGETGEPGERDESEKPEEPGDADSTADGAPAKHKLTGKRIAVIVIAVVLLVALALAGVFAAQRWMLHDDRAQLAGTWRIDGSDAFVTITDSQIELNSETSYTYDIDPAAKTMTYRFGDLEGRGRYWFSADYHTLVIIDGDDYTVWGTAAEDAAHAITHLFDDEPLSGEGAIVLRK